MVNNKKYIVSLYNNESDAAARNVAFGPYSKEKALEKMNELRAATLFNFSEDGAKVSVKHEAGVYWSIKAETGDSAGTFAKCTLCTLVA